MKNKKGNGKLLIVTDDLTGAGDTGVQFSKRDLNTIVLTDPGRIREKLDDFDVLVVDTESRFDDRDTAYRKAHEIGKLAGEEGISHIYKKLDSTLRGNIGAEISGLMDALGIQHALVVPALPEQGRTTIDGNVVVNGVMLAETEIAEDPRNPVNESHIPAIIALQTDKSTSVIKYRDVLSGRQNLVRKIIEQIRKGIEIIVIDATEKADLDLIASAVTGLKDKILMAGSSGLAGCLPRYLDLSRGIRTNIILAGSLSEVTRGQISYACENMDVTLVDIEIGKLFSGMRLQEKNRVMAMVNESSGKGKDVIISSASTKSRVDEGFREGQKQGLTRFEVSDSVASFLGEIAGNIIRGISIHGIVLTGGDVAIKTVKQLGVSGMVIRDEIMPGVPCGYFTDGPARDVLVVSKAGGFGGKDALFRVLEFLKNG